MSPMIQLLKRHSFIILLCAVFVVISTFLITRWFNAQLNPDAVSYITIAQKYAAGDIAHAINGYWGPLLSICMVPLLWLHIDPIVAAKLVSLGAALGIIVVGYWFLLRRAVSRTTAGLWAVALAVFMLTWFTADPITPDTLFAFFTLIFATATISFLAKPTWQRGTLLGMSGAVLYFAKGFGFFLFIGVVGCIALWQWLRERQNIWAVIKKWLPVALVFVTLVAPFVVAISVKYHQLTINTAGTFDHRAYGYYGLSKGNFPPVVNTQGMPPMPPPNSGAVNTWEDPAAAIPLLRDWSLFDSTNHFWFYMGSVVGANLLIIINFIYSHGPLLILGFGTLGVAWLGRGTFRRDYVVFGLIALLMIIGYTLVFAEGRYLSGLVVLGALAVAMQAEVLRKKGYLGQVQYIVAGLLISGVTLVASCQTIIGMKYEDAVWRDVSLALGKVIPDHSKVMFDTFIPAYQTCYYLRLQCYNVVAPGNDVAAYDAQIKQAGVTYVIDYHTNDGNELFKQFAAQYFTPYYEATISGKPITVYTVN